MMKFFRKHNKELLAIFMVGLMIVFLGGTALDSLLQPDPVRTVATTRVGPITNQDYAAAQVSTGFLSALGLNWQLPVAGTAPPLELIDWIILTREAELLGTAASEASVRATMPNAGTVAELARQFRVKPDRVIAAFADFTSVVQTAWNLGSAAIPSEAAVLAAARQSMEKANVKVVMLPAEAFLDEEAQFSEQEIQAQYEQYREREAGPGLNFGYFVPPTLAVQYIKIDRDALAKEVRFGNLERKAKALYEARKERDPAFQRPAEELTQWEAENAEGPKTEKPSPYLSWEEGKDKAIEFVRRQEAEDAAARMADWLLQSAALPWLEVQREKTGYKIPPAQIAESDYFQTLLGNLPDALKYPSAVSVTTTKLFSAVDAESVPEIGEAVFVDPNQVGRSFTLAELAFRSEPIVPNVPEDRDAGGPEFLNLYEASRFPLRDPDLNVYVFRVVNSRPAHVPDSLDEVRDKVVADLRLMRAYEDAKRRAHGLASCDPATSLQEAYDSDVALTERIGAYGAFEAGYIEPPPVARAPQFLAAMGNVGERVQVGFGVGAVPNDVVESWFSTSRVEGQKSVVELTDRASVMVVEWHGVVRTKVSELDETRKALTDQMVRSRQQAVLQEWFDSGNIRARNNFKLAGEG